MSKSKDEVVNRKETDDKGKDSMERAGSDKATIITIKGGGKK